MSLCARCGTEFSCGMADDDGIAPCWCTQYPPLPPSARDDSPGAACYCPACLKNLTRQTNVPESRP